MTDDEESNLTIIKRWARRAVPWLLVIGLAWLVLTQIRAGGGLESGSDVPHIETTLSDGSEFDLAEHRGEVVVLNFWAEWCPPCREEAPALSRVASELEQRGGARLIGLSAERKTLEQVEREARAIGFRFPVGVASADVLRGFEVQMLPTTYVIDPQGRIHDSFVGAVSEEQLRETITEARGNSGS